MGRFEGGSAFVVGGAAGLGLGIARALAEAGVRVAISDINAEHLAHAGDLVRSTGAPVHLVRHDVRDRDRWVDAVDEAEAAIGPIQLLCAAAELASPLTAARASWADWDLVTGINLGGAVNAIATVVPRLRQRGEGGRILLTTSLAGVGAGAGGTLHATGKAAVVALAQCLRQDLAADGITVGLVATAGAVDRPEGEWLELGRRVVQGAREGEAFVVEDRSVGRLVRARRVALLAAVPDGSPTSDGSSPTAR
ncbi:SDR family NAD(P)-dependent oxidoreductase [Blastococcus sp. SYSU D00820]